MAAKSASGKKAARKKGVTKKGAANKKAAKKAAGKKTAAKSTARKPSAKKASVKKSTASKSPVAEVKKPAASAGTARSVKPADRKPLASAGVRKTARSRLIQRSGLETIAPARKMALRTPLTRAAPTRAAKRRPDGPGTPFLPSAVTFREASRPDWPAIRRLLVEAFGRAEEGELVDSLRASRELAAEFVAIYTGKVVAHVAFCNLNVMIDGRAIRAAGLSPLAVAGDLEGRGVGSRLTAFGLENMRGLGNAGVFVLGDPSFYDRFGFSAGLGARFASQWPGPHYLALEFEPGALRGDKGETGWPETFSLL